MPKNEESAAEKNEKPSSAELDPKGRHFPAAPFAKSVDVTVDGTVEIVLILDLGFRIYHEARVSLFGVMIPLGDNAEERHELVRRFATHWIKNGGPAKLDVFVYELAGMGLGAIAEVRRQELEAETFKPLGLRPLSKALVEQGLAEWIS